MGVCFNNDKPNSIHRNVINNCKEVSKVNLEKFIFYKDITEDLNIKMICVNSGYLGFKFINDWVKLFKEIENSSLTRNNTPTAKFSNSSSVLTNVRMNISNKENNSLGFKLINYSEILFNMKNSCFNKLLCKGPPNNIRWYIWMGTARSYNNQEDFDENEALYKTMLEKKLNEKQHDQIHKDLHRTCPDNKFFHSHLGKNKLFNILKALALYDEAVGYCQGMNILAANMLLVSDGNEVETFYLLRFFFSSNYGLKLREFYTRGFPKLHMFIFIIKQLIKIRLPNIFEKIEEIGIGDEIWLFKWIQSLFSFTLDFSIGIRLWDCVIALGLDFILKFSLAFIKLFEKEISLCSDMSEFVNCFKVNINKNSKIEEISDFREKLIKLALMVTIDPSLAQTIEEDYHKHCNNSYYDEGSFYSNNKRESKARESRARESRARESRMKPLESDNIINLHKLKSTRSVTESNKQIIIINTQQNDENIESKLDTDRLDVNDSFNYTIKKELNVLQPSYTKKYSFAEIANLNGKKIVVAFKENDEYEYEQKVSLKSNFSRDSQYMKFFSKVKQEFTETEENKLRSINHFQTKPAFHLYA